jgi:hypothetical protein
MKYKFINWAFQNYAFQAFQNKVHPSNLIIKTYCEITKQQNIQCSPGLEPSLKDGLGFMPSSRKPVAGTKPSGEDFIHIVPPVIMIKTLPSGYCAVILKQLSLAQSSDKGRVASDEDQIAAVDLKGKVKPRR